MSLKNDYNINIFSSKLLELGGKVLAVLTCGRIVALDNLGNAIWTANLKVENVDWFDLVHLPSSANIIVAGKTADIMTHLIKIDAKNGDILIHKQFSDVANFDKYEFMTRICESC